MNGCLRNSRSVLLRLYRPPHLPVAALGYHQHIHTAAPWRSPSSPVLDSTRWTFRRGNLPYHRPYVPPSLRASYLWSTPSQSRWYSSSSPEVTLGTLYQHEIVPCSNRVHRVFSLTYDIDTVAMIKEKHGDNILDPCHPDTICVRHIANDIIRRIHRVIPTKNPRDDDDNNNGPGLVLNGRPNKQGKGVAMLPHAEHLIGMNWEVFVVRNEHGGASTTYNGKLLICTGLLNFVDTDDELAIFIGHEIAHSLEFIAMVEHFIPSLKKLLPFSRRNDIEADHIGIMLLAAAGFDPRVAPRVFQRRGETRGESAWEDYISSHPSYKTRAWLLSQDKVMEKALELYHGQVSAREGSN